MGFEGHASRPSFSISQNDLDVAGQWTISHSNVRSSEIRPEKLQASWKFIWKDTLHQLDITDIIMHVAALQVKIFLLQCSCRRPLTEESKIQVNVKRAVPNLWCSQKTSERERGERVQMVTVGVAIRDTRKLVGASMSLQTWIADYILPFHHSRVLDDSVTDVGRWRRWRLDRRQQGRNLTQKLTQELTRRRKGLSFWKVTVFGRQLQRFARIFPKKIGSTSREGI